MYIHEIRTCRLTPDRTLGEELFSVIFTAHVKQQLLIDFSFSSILRTSLHEVRRSGLVVGFELAGDEPRTIVRVCLVTFVDIHPPNTHGRLANDLAG